MSELPEPLTPPDCDLRGLEYMPLLGHHLFGSDFNARANDSEWRAAVTLWWAAWTQKPAASLPDDDVALCRLADLGRDLKTWAKVKKMALHGFVKCSDGRIYHPVLAQQALLAFEKRVGERKRKAEWREKRAKEKQEVSSNVPGDGTRTETVTATGTERGRDADVPADGTRRDGTGRDIPPKPPVPLDHQAMCQTIADEAGMLGIPPDHRLLREWLALPDMEFERDILPVIRRVTAEVRQREARAPFKFKLFDTAIREKCAADEAERARLRRVAAEWSGELAR